MVEEKMNALSDKSELNIQLIGELYGDQVRQDFNVVPRLEKLEMKMKKIIEILEKLLC